MANVCDNFLNIIFKRWGCIKKILKILEIFQKISPSSHFGEIKDFVLLILKVLVTGWTLFDSTYETFWIFPSKTIWFFWNASSNWLFYSSLHNLQFAIWLLSLLTSYIRWACFEAFQCYPINSRALFNNLLFQGI